MVIPKGNAFCLFIDGDELQFLGKVVPTQGFYQRMRF